MQMKLTLNRGFLKFASAAKKRVKETTAKEVHSRMEKGDKSFMLVDVREDNEWEKGHLPGAIHMARGVIERDIETVSPNKKQELVLYCGGGYRSALAAENLAKMGYKNVLSMDGGVKAWKESKLKIVRSTQKRT